MGRDTIKEKSSEAKFVDKSGVECNAMKEWKSTRLTANLEQKRGKNAK